MSAGLEVVRAGLLTTVQDLGRPGLAHLGVPRSGAADDASHRLANALVGNRASAATLESTLTGVSLRALERVIVAVSGASCPVFVGGVPAPWGAPVRLAPGQVLDVGDATAGLRSYVAVRGGFDVPPVLGSRSRDVLSGLGPAPLMDGVTLAVGHDVCADVRFGAPRAEPPPTPEVIVLPVVLGPRADWLTPGALRALAESTFTVDERSNRVGLRLAGPPLERSRTGELASEGMVLGAVQVPSDGQPVVFLADHPTTGGYPVVGVVVAESVGAAAQARPGASVRFEVR